MKLTRSPWSSLVAEKRPPIAPPEPPQSLLLAADPEPIRYPAAFCAPGTEPIAAITLWLHGEHVASIHGSRMLEGSSSIVIVAEPPESALEPGIAPHRTPRHRADALGFTWREEMRFLMRVPRALPLSLSGVIGPYHGETLPDPGNQGCYFG